MITQEQFEKIESQYGCGYWNVCDDHACPCHPTADVSQGFNVDTYSSMEESHKKFLEQLDKESSSYDDDYHDNDDDLEDYYDDDYFCDLED